MRNMVSMVVMVGLWSALATTPVMAAPDPTTTWPEAKLGEGERFAGQTTKPVMDAPPQRWISPSGHAVLVAVVWTKDRVVLRAYWNDPKPRTQDVVTIPGPVASTSEPFLTDHKDGQLAVAITGNIGGPDKGFAYRLKFDPKKGFSIAKKATYVYGYNNNKSPEWLQGKFEINDTWRAQSLASSFRFQRHMKDDSYRNLKVVTRGKGKDAKSTEETLSSSDLVAKWDAAGRRPAVGFGIKCTEKDHCCTFDTKKLSAWLHLEKVCFVDNKPGALYLVAPE